MTTHKTQSDLDHTLMALADPTRLALLHRRSEGEARVTELARPFAMSLNAVSKHLLTHEDVLPEWASRTEAGRGMILDSLARTLK
jgi:DNA-binding transcriptional ArsR family regulator